MTTNFFIVTGLSGAGKSQALKILEDLGFFCVDNLPVELVPSFADLRRGASATQNVALGIDIRAGKSLANLDAILAQLIRKDIRYRIIFFTADDATLLKRYSETRRRHPLGRRVLDGVRRERRMMARIHDMADQEIDTSHLTLNELKEILARLFSVPQGRTMAISLVSFGYKYGMPVDADIVMDVRFLPNPNYVPSLRAKTGKDAPVRNYVQRQALYREFFDRFSGLLSYLVPNYIREGKSHLTIAIGCTGGRHRSVAVTESVARHMRSMKFGVQVYHRDIQHKI